MVGCVTPTILAMDAFETCFCRRRRISSSLPSSRDFPSTPFGRPSSRPLARADANPSRVRSEIKSLSTSANRPNKATITLVCRSCSVATALHQRYPDKAIVIAGDDDHGIENNPGREKALVAAQALAGRSIHPNVSAEQRGKGLTDFNDLAIQNPGLVSRPFGDVLHRAKEEGFAASQSIDVRPAV